MKTSLYVYFCMNTFLYNKWSAVLRLFCAFTFVWTLPYVSDLLLNTFNVALSVVWNTFVMKLLHWYSAINLLQLRHFLYTCQIVRTLCCTVNSTNTLLYSMFFPLWYEDWFLCPVKYFDVITLLCEQPSVTILTLCSNFADVWILL